MHFWSKISFWKKKVSKMTKIHIFHKFQLWVCDRYWPIIGLKVSPKIRLSLLSCRNFLFSPTPKIYDFISKKQIFLLPTPKKGSRLKWPPEKRLPWYTTVHGKKKRNIAISSATSNNGKGHSRTVVFLFFLMCFRMTCFPLFFILLHFPPVLFKAFW